MTLLPPFNPRFHPEWKRKYTSKGSIHYSCKAMACKAAVLDPLTPADPKNKIKLALVCTPLNNENLDLAKQISCDEIVYYDMDTMPLTVEALTEVKDQVEAKGLKLTVVEGGPKMDKIVTGEDGREQQLETYK
eukprot:gene25665-11372_t